MLNKKILFTAVLISTYMINSFCSSPYKGTPSEQLGQPPILRIAELFEVRRKSHQSTPRLIYFITPRIIKTPRETTLNLVLRLKKSN